MKFLITIIYFLTIGFAASAQNGKGITYKCIYADTLTNTEPMPDFIIRDLVSKSAQIKDLPDSLTGKLDSALRKAISFAGVPMQLQTRSVEATEDTTTIVMSDEVISLGLSQKNRYKKMVLVKGRKIVAASADDNEAIPLPPDEDRHFKPTGEARKILSYLCDAYVSADGRVTIWITKELPSSINPGVRNVDIDGAILSFSITGNGGLLISTLEKIEMVR